MKEDVIAGKVPVYANVVVTPEHVDVHYFFFYAFNGAILDQVPTAGIHEGDWEHTKVRLSLEVLHMLPDAQPDDQWVRDQTPQLRSFIQAIFYARHGHEGRWYFQDTSPDCLKDNGYLLVEDSCHHIVYSAKGGHASYTRPCQRNRRYRPLGLPLRVIDDYTDDLGLHWDTWRNVVVLDPEDDNQKWLRFSGQWGGKRTSYIGADGPYAPLQKTYYFTSDPPPTRYNSITRDIIPHPCGPHLRFWCVTGLCVVGCLFCFGTLVILYSHQLHLSQPK